MVCQRKQFYLGLVSLSVSISLGAVVFNNAVFAQAIPNQNFNLPGQVLQDFQLKTVPSEIQPDTQRQTQAPSKVEGAPVTPPVEANPADIKTVFIKTITLEGATLLNPKTVRSIIAPYENHNDRFSDLQEMADKLTALYQEHGYVTSRVYIPPQKVADGHFVVKALEARMGKLAVQEGRFFRRQSIAPYVAPKTGDPFNLDVLKTSIRQLNENPDRNVQARLKPGEKTGDTDVVLSVTDRFPLHFTPSYDNLGRGVLGNNRLGAQIADNNVLGFGDTELVSPSFTRHSFGIVDHYELPVGDHGTRIGFEHAYSSLQLGQNLAPLNIHGHAVTYSPFVIQPIINKEHYKLTADTAFDFKNLGTNFDTAPALSTGDRIRELRPGLNFEEYDRQGRTFIRSEVGLGLDVFGATSGTRGTDGLNPGRVGAGSKFIRLTESIIRTQKLPWNSYDIIKVIGALSPEQLPSSDQFQVGGAFTVRGYREGTLVGDQGVLISNEWRIPFYLIPKSLVIPRTNYSLRDNIQFVSFVDYGLTNYNDYRLVSTTSVRDLLGAGVGLRVRLTRFLTGRIDIGEPLIRVGGQKSNPRIHFGLESAIF